MFPLLAVNLRWIVRDRVLQALLALSLFLLLLVPVISSFSMRQTQELAVTLSLSFVSLILLVFSLLLGSTMVWRDIERRYTFAVLSLPLERGTYLLAKFCSVAVFLTLSALFAGLCAAAAISISTLQYPSAIPVQWGMIALAIGMDLLKYLLLAAIAILVTTVSTSFFMPFFVTLALFLTGSASQEVYDFVASGHAGKMSSAARNIIRAVYYVLPNFGAFDFKLQAVYPIPLNHVQLLYTSGYFLLYTTLLLSLSIWVFSRRELT
jgi:ABC-type transport system involved in multi-copper enzyme maturation permease subunit